MYLDDRRPTITPQLARRVAMLGGVAVVVLGIVLLRLWYLQVLSGDQYVAEANNNRVREIKVAAPRGEIVDRNGRVLVDNRMGLAVKITPDELPREQDKKDRLYRRLADLLDLRKEEIRTSVREQLRAVPFSAATVKQDVGLSTVQFIEENRRAFPGVTAEKVFLRSYPHDRVGAHLFGTVGEVSPQQLSDPRYSEVEQGDRVGQSGIESTYDRFLRGVNGATKVQVDAAGSLTPRRLPRQEPVPGRQLRLAIDLDVQETGHEVLGTERGAFVVMEAKTGQVRALGSAPSFDPNLFSKLIKQRDLDALSSEAEGQPLLNRAVQGDYPAGSTFKLITSVAGLQERLIQPATTVFDSGAIEVGGREWTNAGKQPNGSVDLRRALEVSSDVYYYRLGQAANAAGDGQAIQRWSSRLGIGRSTGIDLPAEQPGVVPDRKWRERLNQSGAGDGRPWSVGDNMNLSVGQGDLSTNPLQMAVAYAAVANGGFVVRPRLAMRIEDGQSRPVQELDPPPRRRLAISPGNRQAILDGLRGAASGPRGTSTDVFKGFPIQIAGKTGTAEHAGQADQSWYVALAPYPNPEYVVVVTFERGGFGAETAAPAACRILATMYGVPERDRCSAGTSRTR